MSDEENDVFSGSVTSQPQMVNVQTSGPMYMVERSSAPQVIGILVIIYGVLLLLASLFGLVDGFRQSLLTASVIGQILTGVVNSGATAYAGFLMFSYKKQGIWIAFGAIGAGWANSSIWTYFRTRSMISASPDSSELGGLSEIITTGGAVYGLFCSAICGLIVAIPLFMANSVME